MCTIPSLCGPRVPVPQTPKRDCEPSDLGAGKGNFGSPKKQ